MIEGPFQKLKSNKDKDEDEDEDEDDLIWFHFFDF